MWLIWLQMLVSFLHISVAKRFLTKSKTMNERTKISLSMHVQNSKEESSVYIALRMRNAIIFFFFPFKSSRNVLLNSLKLGVISVYFCLISASWNCDVHK